MDISLALALGAISFSSQDIFAPPEDAFRTFGTLEGVLVANLDGDGFGDLVVHAGIAGVILSPLGQATRKTKPIGSQPGRVTSTAAGDFDGDGLDEVLVQSESPGAVVWQWFDGGASGEAFILGGGAVDPPSATRLAVFDVDGDGDGDVVAQLHDGAIKWFPNDSAFISSAGAMVVPAAPHDWAARDVDGDGLTDLVVRDEVAGELRLLLSLPGGGFGTPIFVVALPAGSSQAWALVDDDQDGDLDVAFVAQGECNRVEQVGTGIFGAPSTILAATSTFEVVGVNHAADLDGNGNVDLILKLRAPGILNFEDVVLMGTGGATYAPPFRAPRGYGAVRLVDMDGDLDADSISELGGVIEIRVAATVAGVPSLFDRPPLRIELPSTSLEPLAIADLEGDGDLDVIAFSESRIVALLSSGSAASFDALELADPSNVASNCLAISPGDLDGDGRQELVCVDDSGRLAILALTGNVLSLASAQPNEPFWAVPGGLNVLDVDDDGDLDIACLTGFSAPLRTLVVHLNGGAGASWSRSIVGSVGFRLYPDHLYVFEDLDGDGFTDVLLPQAVNGLTLLRRGTGSGPFGLFELALGDGALRELADLDGDGLEDIVTTCGRYALRNAGSPTYGMTAGLVADLFSQPLFNPHFRDFDGDGIVDCLTRQDVSDNVLRLHVGQPGLAFPAATEELDPAISLHDDFPLFADLDDDGDLDVLQLESVNGASALRIYRGLGRPQAGSAICGPAAANSSGTSARMIGFGHVAPGATDLELRTVGVPSGAFGILVVSMTPAGPSPVAGSAGRLCLGGAIGRYDGPGQILPANLAGEFRASIDPSRLPQPNGTAAAQAGQTWGFQTWFRDSAAGVSTSNFSDALLLDF